MKLGELIQLQSSGGINIAEGYSDYFAVVGGVKLNRDHCNLIATNLGWVENDLTPMQVIEKTNKFLKGIKKYIGNEAILENTEVTFQNRRRVNTLSYFDRIKLVYPGHFDLTILSGMPGVGGRYGVYSSENNFSTPIKACNSLKELGTWINGLV